MLCSMEANGVTPIPAPISTACSAWKMWKEGEPYGPSMKTYNKRKIDAGIHTRTCTEAPLPCLASTLLCTTLASSPGPSLRGRKGLVHTDCACAHLYPKSGYIVYSRKILSKLSIYNYITFSNHTRVWPTETRDERKEFVRAVDRQATPKTLTQELVWTKSQMFTW